MFIKIIWNNAFFPTVWQDQWLLPQATPKLYFRMNYPVPKNQRHTTVWIFSKSNLWQTLLCLFLQILIQLMTRLWIFSKRPIRVHAKTPCCRPTLPIALTVRYTTCAIDQDHWSFPAAKDNTGASSIKNASINTSHHAELDPNPLLLSYLVVRSVDVQFFLIWLFVNIFTTVKMEFEAYSNATRSTSGISILSDVSSDRRRSA